MRDRDVAVVGLRPAHTDLIARRAEQPADVRGHIREEPARIFVLGDAPARQLGLEAIDRATAVRVQQATQELPGKLVDDALLPGLQRDRTTVLASKPVLRE